MILNLKGLNRFIPYHHFKMDSFESALFLVSKNTYFGSIDLRHAYYSVPNKQVGWHFRYNSLTTVSVWPPIYPLKK